MKEDQNLDTGLEVIPAAEVKAGYQRLANDITELKNQMAADREKTGLAIEQRADDLQKAMNAVEDFSKRVEELDAKVQQNAFAQSFGTSSGELRDALDSFKAGFREFNGDNEAVARPEGTRASLKHLVEGVFTPSDFNDDEGDTGFMAPRHKSLFRLQKAADNVMVVDAMLRSQMDASQLREYAEKGGARSTKTYARFKAIAEQFTKAAGDLIDRTTEVANWIPTQYSAQLYEQIKIGLPILGLFPEIQMAAPTVVLPLDMNDKEAMRVTEITSATNADPYADANFVNPSAISSNKITLEAEKLRSRFWISQEATEDSIVAMLPLLGRKHNRNIGEAIEDAIINGQPTNIDTGGTHFGKTNPLVAAGTDARDAWDGLRRFAAQYSGAPSTRVDNSNAKPTAAGMRGLRAAMGEYGVDPMALAYIFGIFGYVKLLDDSNVLTLEKFGPQATIRTGTLGMVDGVDVLVSRRIPGNANATGIIDGTTTNRTLAIAVHRDACVLGNRRRITLAQQTHVSSDTTELVAFWRGDFQPVYPVASVPFVGLLYNILGA